MRLFKIRRVILNRGLTLLELVIVLAILTMFAGLVVFNLSPGTMAFAGPGGNKTASQIATEASMAQIKQAIGMAGSMEKPGYWDDMNHDMWFWPQNLEWLTKPPTDSVTLPYDAFQTEVNYYNSMMAYSASKKVGWHGPYISFQSTKTIPLDPSRGFTARLGGGAYVAPIDAWGRPIVVQMPSQYGGADFSVATARGISDQEQYLNGNSRLVSAGPNGVLDTELNILSLQTYDDFQAYPELVGDDVVIWLRR